MTNRAPARTRATRCGALTARHLSCAAMISLKAMASPAAFDPGPRVILVRCRTVAKVDSINRPCRAGQAELVSSRVRGESLAVGLEGLDDAVMSLRLVGPAALFGVVAQQSDVAKLFAQDG